MSNYPETRRRCPRIPMRLPTVISFRPSERSVLRELTSSISVSPYGASFHIRRRFEPGQVIHISLPLPREMRKFDESAEEFTTYAVVRYCRAVVLNQTQANQVGVAFIGKEPPPSYRKNPLCLYKTSGYEGDALWNIIETEDALDRREHPRYTVPVTVILEVRDPSGLPIAEESTVAENIGSGGAAVFSCLALKVGDFVKVRCDQYNVALNAEVRNIRTGKDGMPRLHLKFTDGEFPLEGIEQG